MMNRFPKVRFGMMFLLILTSVSVVAVACGEADSGDFSSTQNAGGGDQAAGGFGFDGGSANSDAVEDRRRQSVAGATATSAAARPTTIPRPAATPAPAGPPRLSTDDILLPDSGQPAPPASPLDQNVAQASQQRIIVRNVDMSVEVINTSAAIDEISAIASLRGGWVVSTRNVEVHRGAVDIRVPADRLDDTLVAIRQIAASVVSEVSTSQDFTEEFTDTTARIQTLQDTVDALRALFARAEKIEDALTIQKEITRVQSDIESMQARISFLSQSAAFSLIRISVLALPQEIEIVAGDDVLAAAGRGVRFRAEFTPPEGIENFRIEWDFGDGTSKQTVTGIAPVNIEGRVISAPVVHTYNDETDSPYIVKVVVTGTGRSGAAEGEDVMVVTVNRVPPIEVFAGDEITADAGEEVAFRGRFTRPDGVENLSYTWDFGDATAPVTVDADPGATVATVKHMYATSRPQAYEVILTVRGETAAGSTEGSGTTRVLVTEPESLTAGGFAPGDSSKSALRALSSIGSGLATAAIWIGVLSPLWLAAGFIGWLFYRNQRRNMARLIAERAGPREREDEKSPS